MNAKGKYLLLSILYWSGLFFLSACHSSNSKPTDELSHESSGKVVVVDATDHSELESPILNLFVNSVWGVDSQFCLYENPEVGYEPLMIYDIMEEKEFFNESSTGGINNHRSPIVCIFFHGEEPSNYKSEIVKPLKSLKAGKETFSSGNQTITIFTYRNVWCKNQLVVLIPIGSKQTIEDFSSNRLKMERWLVNEEYRLGTESIQGSSSYRDSLGKEILLKYGLSLPFKYTFNLVMDRPNAHGRVLWLRNETAQNHSNILVQLIDSSMNLSDFVTDSMVRERNRFTKSVLKNSEGGWVEISESGSFPLKSKKIAPHIAELRGWYSELNTTRRGPFIRRYLVDKSLHRTIIMDAFVFAPNQSRLPLMRELERYILACESVKN